MSNKTAKMLSLSLIIALMVSALIPIALVNAANIPNPTNITYVSIGGPETVDPHWAYDTASAEVIQNIYEPLLMYGGGASNGVDPTEGYIAVAADWWPGYGVNEGNLIDPIKPGYAGAEETWVFRIRTGMKWQDATYGNVTPYDFEYSFKRGLLFDHTNGPMWMVYEPLTGKDLSYDYDLNGDGDLNATEYATLAAAVDWAIDSNSTHVWFNLPAGYAPFQQILAMSWSYVMCAQWCKDQDSETTPMWQGDINDYDDFKRTWDLPEPGPLMNPAKAMGSGPYKLKAMNEDPNVGWYVLEKFNDYWQGWAGNHVTLATVKNVAEWANRKAQFFSTDPTLQADLCYVPRSNCPELHENGDKDDPALAGIRLIQPVLPSQAMDAFYFNFKVAAGSPYMPKVGGVEKPELFTDRNMRLVLCYLFNATQYINDVFLGEATQSGVFIVPGTAYYNASKPMYGIDVTEARAHLALVLGGTVKSQGLVLRLTYNAGNTARQTLCTMLAYGLTNLIDWGPSAVVDIAAIAVPWATLLPEIRAKKAVLFNIGWLADFPDAHNWVFALMHPSGTYPSRQSCRYGLNPETMNWAPNREYGPIPYTNAKGEYVSAINNTYIAHLIDRAVKEGNVVTRQKLYGELMDIYYAEATQLPTVTALRRHYERSWVNGWGGTYNENPIAPGMYFYTMYKAATGSVVSVDISAAATITNASKVYPLIQLYYGEMRLNGEPAVINYTLHVVCNVASVPVVVLIALERNSTEGTYFFPVQFLVSLAQGESYTGTVSWYEDGVESVMEEGNWTISLYTSPVATAGGAEVEDTNLANNKVDHPQKVEAIVHATDINGDGIVDIADIYTCALAYGTVPGQDRWNPICDINGDEFVDISDIYGIALQFGWSIK
jgi:peptide/nickel transport system substrate-binding protein